jgi:hypothetical protein
VADAALSFVVPGGATVFRTPVQVSGAAELAPQDRVIAGNIVSAGWSETFSTPAMSGRPISDADRPGAPKVAVVNEAFVRRFLPNQNPLGHIITFEPPSPRAGRTVVVEIAGIVPDVVYRLLREPVGPTMYLPLAQRDEPFFAEGLSTINLIVKTHGDSPMAVARSVSAAVTGVNADLSFTMQPLKQQIDGSIAPQRVAALLSGWFGGLALLLALIGLYGVTSYTTNQSRKEIALRLALGAAAPAVLRALLLRVLTLIAVGLAIGLVVSVWASKFVSALLVGVGPHDLVAFAATAVVLVLSGAVAGWAPAYRASRLDPALLLRES